MRHSLIFKAIFLLIVSGLVQSVALEGRTYFTPFLYANCIVSTQRINVEGYPSAWNPSLVRTDEGLVLTFRITPDPNNLHISYIGVTALDDDFKPKFPPTILDTRLIGDAPSQSEDARVFSCNGKIYLIFNDNPNVTSPSAWQHRDLYIAELHRIEEEFFLAPAKMLFHHLDYETRTWQKNWVPFEWNNSLLLGYSIAPHEILCPDLVTGECVREHFSQTPVDWAWGVLRGGTPAILVDGEYLAFFHSGMVMRSRVSNRAARWHYFMGAYTFSAKPPFEVTSTSTYPLVAPGFYTSSDYDKRVIFPGGIVDCGSYIAVAYGKDDREVWIAKIDKARLKESLVPVGAR